MRVATIAALVLGTWVQLTAIEIALDVRALDEAVAIGQSRVEQQRTRFHAPYLRHIAVPPVDSVDVVTPFRRIVLAAERQGRAGAGLFSHRQAQAVLEREGNGLDLVVELTFHPHHFLVGVPEYEVALVSVAGEVAAMDIERQPRFGARVAGQPRTGPTVPDDRRRTLPLAGAVVTARFDAAAVSQPMMTIVVREAGTTLVEVPTDFSRLR